MSVPGPVVDTAYYQQRTSTMPTVCNPTICDAILCNAYRTMPHYPQPHYLRCTLSAERRGWRDDKDKVVEQRGWHNAEDEAMANAMLRTECEAAEQS